MYNLTTYNRCGNIVGMTTVSVFEFRNNLAEYLRMVEQGEEVAVTRFDRPVGTMTPFRKTPKGYEKFFGIFAGKNRMTGEEYVNKIRRNKEERKYTKKLTQGKI